MATVTGIIKDIPENSQIRADMIISMSTLTRRFNPGIDNQWGNYGCASYVLMKPGTNALAMQAKFPAFLDKHNVQEMRKSQMFATIFLRN
jgi:putative ABC transport system permease protein